MIQNDIRNLVAYGLETGLVLPEDEIYTVNRLLELFQLDEIDDADDEKKVNQKSVNQNEEAAVNPEINLENILRSMLDYAVETGLIENDNIVERDLFDTKIMSVLMPRPSEVIRTFQNYYQSSPEKATEYFYKLSCDSDYIRRYRIVKDQKWVTATEYGDLDITINLSKPEKDPRAIAAAKKAKQSGYPKCLLCKENEGYAGRINHPARQNHRIIPITIQESNGAFNILLMYITMNTVSFLMGNMFP